MKRVLVGLLAGWTVLFQAPGAQAICGDPPVCGDLHGITTLGIVVEKLDSDAPLGLTKESIQRTVLGALRSRLPKLMYRPRFVGHSVDGIPSHAASSSKPSFSARTWAGVR